MNIFDCQFWKLRHLVKLYAMFMKLYTWLFNTRLTSTRGVIITCKYKDYKQKKDTITDDLRSLQSMPQCTCLLNTVLCNS